MSKPKQHRADANREQSSEYKAELKKNAKDGWQGAYRPIAAAKIIREISSRARRERASLPL